MKKGICLLLTVLLLCCLAACATPAENSSEDSTPSATSSAAVSSADSLPESAVESLPDNSVPETEGRTLIVYFSATGNTESAARTIAEVTNGDLFELVPVEPYTSADLNYSNADSRVSIEHANPDLRTVELVASTVSDWADYDTVYIGYPIWWGIAAWPVDSFVENNDFTGKTVIPFATSASSGMGESGQLLEEMAGTGEWQEGERFRSGADEADVQEWVNGLGL